MGDGLLKVKRRVPAEHFRYPLHISTETCLRRTLHRYPLHISTDVSDIHFTFPQRRVSAEHFTDIHFTFPQTCLRRTLHISRDVSPQNTSQISTSHFHRDVSL
ncbi:UNVERIFIED_CONTAM: hypothetical protein FKN15_038115 [Acipenser sinensis]